MESSSISEPQNATSRPNLASVAGGWTARPLKEEPTELYYSDDSRKCPQPPAEEIKACGVKIRDFAYESTFPPLSSYKHKLPRPDPSRIQKQPDPMMWPGLAAEAGKGAGAGISRAPNKLGLKTEGLVRQQGFQDLEGMMESPQRRYSSSPHFQSSPPSHYMDSQSRDPDPYIVTPTVTPNGSLRWKDTSHIPIEVLDVYSHLSASGIPPVQPRYEAELILPPLSSPLPPEQSTVRLASQDLPEASQPKKRQRFTPPESPLPLAPM
ncbi:hypothetical protein BT96DRAFT_949777 [Gymnopus androsaceus JB14]|uniref:Uncharacterized protein n=1 Tax=Gymnopus androsaceus JB14 TaxID=1447944 RepID=A0A6A4GJJ0_9AGAR|nr:hypothetical protein BT96DRAFT_949777 [Gymnopus androsaceus JB14]